MEENIDAKRQHINILESQLDDDEFPKNFAFCKESTDLKSSENSKKHVDSNINPVHLVSSLPKQNCSNVADLQEVQTGKILLHIACKLLFYSNRIFRDITRPYQKQ